MFADFWSHGRHKGRELWQKYRFGLFLLACFFAGAIGSYLLWLNGRIIPGVSIAGFRVGGMKTTEVVHLLDVEMNRGQQKKVLLNYQSRTFDVVLGTIGIQPDVAATVRQAYLVGRSGSVIKRILVMVETRRDGYPVEIRFKHHYNILNSFYRLLDASLGREPVRAVVRVAANGAVHYTSSVEGRLIDRKKLTELFETALYRQNLFRIEIPVGRVIPTLTSADIKRWRLNQVIGMFVTQYNPNAMERTHNIRTACSALDNVIIYPGQNFSFNTWIGPRIAQNGYKEAPVVYRGKIVPGIGGGVCQVSTTLYNAVLLANLQIVKRSNHSLPSTYVPLGRDATVVTGGADFIFTNNLASPILLTAEVDSANVRVAVLGVKGDWDKVDLKTETVETYPFEVKETSDPEILLGEKIQVQPGKEGTKIKLWRSVIYHTGLVKKSLVGVSIYPAQPEEYKVGTKLP